MEASRLATTHDYEAYARELLDQQTFEHLQGSGKMRNPDNVNDFENIKLKALGLMSMARFMGTGTIIMGKRHKSPICVGPLPPLHDVKLTLNGAEQNAGAAIKSVCDKLGMLCVVPLEQVREVVRGTETKNPFLLYVVPN